MDSSYAWNAARGYISFAAYGSYDLDNIPPYPAKPFNENSNDITSLADANNFLYLINPSEYETNAGFDGAYLDNLLAFDLFEEVE